MNSNTLDAVEYYSTIKRNELLTHLMIGNLIIMLSGRSQTVVSALCQKHRQTLLCAAPQSHNLLNYNKSTGFNNFFFGGRIGVTNQETTTKIKRSHKGNLLLTRVCLAVQKQ